MLKWRRVMFQSMLEGSNWRKLKPLVYCSCPSSSPSMQCWDLHWSLLSDHEGSIADVPGAEKMHLTQRRKLTLQPRFTFSLSWWLKHWNPSPIEPPVRTSLWVFFPHASPDSFCKTGVIRTTWWQTLPPQGVQARPQRSLHVFIHITQGAWVPTEGACSFYTMAVHM